MKEIGTTGIMCGVICVGGCAIGCAACLADGPIVVADAVTGGTAYSAAAYSSIAA